MADFPPLRQPSDCTLPPLTRARRVTAARRWPQLVLAAAVFVLGAATHHVVAGSRGLDSSIGDLSETVRTSPDHSVRRAALAAGRIQTARYVRMAGGIAQDAADPLREDARIYLNQLKETLNAATSDFR